MTVPRSLACPLARSCVISPGTGARFGEPAALGGGLHTGLDLQAAIGTRVIGPAPGIVRRHGFDLGRGTWAELQHDGFVTRYAHLSSILLRDGFTVGLGDTFARSGASGTVTGPHLHFEVLVDGQYVDPEPLLFGANTTTSGLIPPNPDGSCPAGYIRGAQSGAAWCVPIGNLGNVPVIGGALEVAADPVGVFLPILVNLGVIAVVVILALSGVRQVLSAGQA